MSAEVVDSDMTEDGAALRARGLRQMARTTAEIVAAFGRNKISTAIFVLGEVADGKDVDQELIGLAKGALSDLRSFGVVLDGLDGGALKKKGGA